MSAIRYPTKEKAAVEVYGKNLGMVAQLRNLSVSGACLECHDQSLDLSQGDLIRMTIDLKALNKKHRLNAEVVWVEGKSVGVNFVPREKVLEKLAEKY